MMRLEDGAIATDGIAEQGITCRILAARSISCFSSPARANGIRRLSRSAERNRHSPRSSAASQ